MLACSRAVLLSRGWQAGLPFTILRPPSTRAHPHASKFIVATSQHMMQMRTNLMLLLLLAGCGTTRWSDTARTATEQLLISTAIDRAINQIDFKPLAGKDVYFDAQYLRGVTDEQYIISSIRQHLLASGCTLKSKREEATYVVEARAGAIGTNRHDVMIGIPALNVPAPLALAGVPPTIPEIPLAKTTDQKGVAKLGLFCYNQKTGRAVWQSGVFPIVTNAKDTWILGTGPFSRGSIYDGTRFAGSRILLPFGRRRPGPPMPQPPIPVTAEAVFTEPEPLVNDNSGAAEQPVQAQAPNQNDRAALERQDDSEATPAAHIVRLPPADLEERPDLQEKLEQAQKKRQQDTDQPSQADEPASNARADNAAEDPPRAGPFNWLQPRTWFEP